MDNFTNEKRNRYYGIRVGDIVKYYTHEGEVIELDPMNNNSVLIKTESKPVFKNIKAVAEWCEIITKVEDREDIKYGPTGDDERDDEFQSKDSGL
jgi:hypothetical protein